MRIILSITTLVILHSFAFNSEELKNNNRTSNNIQNDGTEQHHFFSQTHDLTGSWSLALRAFDDNTNRKLDDEERKNGNTGKHFYRFNADGTCLIFTMKLKGSYELKNEGGKQRLYTYADNEGTRVQENAWYLISVGKTELVLLSQDKQTFWIYKRVPGQ